MNVRVEFIEKRDNSTKLKLLLFPYREENQAGEMPKLPITGDWRISLTVRREPQGKGSNSTLESWAVHLFNIEAGSLLMGLIIQREMMKWMMSFLRITWSSITATLFSFQSTQCR